MDEPIEGLPQRIVAETLGLDSSNFNRVMRGSSAEGDEEEIVYYTLASIESFRRRECQGCGKAPADEWHAILRTNFPVVVHVIKDPVTGTHTLKS